MKRLISTLAVTAALSLGLWTLAVTFSPIASNFSDGDPVSAPAASPASAGAEGVGVGVIASIADSNCRLKDVCSSLLGGQL